LIKKSLFECAKSCEKIYQFILDIKIFEMPKNVEESEDSLPINFTITNAKI